MLQTNLTWRSKEKPMLITNKRVIEAVTSLSYTGMTTKEVEFNPDFGVLKRWVRQELHLNPQRLGMQGRRIEAVENFINLFEGKRED
jgi:hypothetical protein